MASIKDGRSVPKFAFTKFTFDSFMKFIRSIFYEQELLESLTPSELAKFFLSKNGYESCWSSDSRNIRVVTTLDEVYKFMDYKVANGEISMVELYNIFDGFNVDLRLLIEDSINSLDRVEKYISSGLLTSLTVLDTVNKGFYGELVDNVSSVDLDTKEVLTVLNEYQNILEMFYRHIVYISGLMEYLNVNEIKVVGCMLSLTDFESIYNLSLDKLPNKVMSSLTSVSEKYNINLDFKVLDGSKLLDYAFTSLSVLWSLNDELVVSERLDRLIEKFFVDKLIYDELNKFEISSVQWVNVLLQDYKAANIEFGEYELDTVSDGVGYWIGVVKNDEYFMWDFVKTITSFVTLDLLFSGDFEKIRVLFSLMDKITFLDSVLTSYVLSFVDAFMMGDDINTFSIKELISSFIVGWKFRNEINVYKAEKFDLSDWFTRTKFLFLTDEFVYSDIHVDTYVGKIMLDISRTYEKMVGNIVGTFIDDVYMLDVVGKGFATSLFDSLNNLIDLMDGFLVGKSVVDDVNINDFYSRFISAYKTSFVSFIDNWYRNYDYIIELSESLSLLEYLFTGEQYYQFLSEIISLMESEKLEMSFNVLEKTLINDVISFYFMITPFVDYIGVEDISFGYLFGRTVTDTFSVTDLEEVFEVAYNVIDDYTLMDVIKRHVVESPFTENILVAESLFKNVFWVSVSGIFLLESLKRIFNSYVNMYEFVYTIEKLETLPIHAYLLNLVESVEVREAFVNNFKVLFNLVSFTSLTEKIINTTDIRRLDRVIGDDTLLASLGYNLNTFIESADAVYSSVVKRFTALFDLSDISWIDMYKKQLSQLSFNDIHGFDVKYYLSTILDLVELLTRSSQYSFEESASIIEEAVKIISKASADFFSMLDDNRVDIDRIMLEVSKLEDVNVNDLRIMYDDIMYVVEQLNKMFIAEGTEGFEILDEYSYEVLVRTFVIILWLASKINSNILLKSGFFTIIEAESRIWDVILLIVRKWFDAS